MGVGMNFQNLPSSRGKLGGKSENYPDPIFYGTWLGK